MQPPQDMAVVGRMKGPDKPDLKDKEEIMDSLTETFERQANILLIPLWILLILDIGEKQEKRRRKRILRLDREFNDKAMKQSRNRYRRQVAPRRAPRP